MTALAFLVISPSKTGSTWLASNLNKHHQIFIPTVKEVNYFSFLSKFLELDWYREVLSPAGERAAGDASPCYAILPSNTIREIYRLFPAIKLIYLMRDPVERSWSHAKHNHTYREANFRTYRQSIDDVPNEMWLENFSHPWPVSHGDYLGHLRRWTAVFPQEQLFVGFFDQLVADPRSLLRDIIGFLGVTPEANFTRYPLHEKILEGPRKPLLPMMRTHLRRLHSSRTRQLANYLRTTFRLSCPANWCDTFAALPASALHADVLAYPDDDCLAALLDNNPPSQVILIEEGFCGYNLVWHRGRLFAFAQTFGPIAAGSMEECDFDRYAQRKQALTAATLDALKETVRCAAAQRSELCSETVLVQEGYLNFNLLVHKGRFLAVAQRLGPVDPRSIEGEALKPYEAREEAFAAATWHELKKIVRCVYERTLAARTEVHLVEEGYAGCNLVSYRGRFFAFDQRHGPTDLRKTIDDCLDQRRADKRLLTAPTLNELKAAVDRTRRNPRSAMRRFLARSVRALALLRPVVRLDSPTTTSVSSPNIEH